MQPTVVIALVIQLSAAVAAARTLDQYAVAGPQAHRNLAVYILRGPNELEETRFLTTDEALSNGTLIVRETSEVNRLRVENVGDSTTYLFAGDIVKGGKQDRVLQQDLVLAPKSGPVAVDVYCVESGRWAKRGGESAQTFHASKAMITSKSTKVAVRGKKSQDEVWQSVAGTQSKLGGMTGRSVAAAASPTSLQLSLEDGDVQRAAAPYVQALARLAADIPDAVGVAIAINGAVDSIEIFPHHGLFVRVWPKLLHAAAVEAASELRADAPTTVPPITAFAALIEDAERGEEKSQRAGRRVDNKVKETSKSIGTKSTDARRNDAVLRRSYIAK